MRRIFNIYASLITALFMIGAATAVYADDGGRGRDGRGGGRNDNNMQMNNNNNNMQNNNMQLRTRLVGAAIGGITPEGQARFRTNPRSMRLNVEVENVMSTNPVLDVSISHAGTSTIVGQITLRSGEGELELDTRDGNIVPTVVSGDMVVVSNGSTPILSGVF